MKQAKKTFTTVKEVPKDAVAKSHQLMIRAGLVKQLAAGVFSFLPMGNKVLQKVQNIIREEINNIDGQEFLLPALNPKEIWQKTGRIEAMGEVMFHIKNNDYVLATTHEEIMTFNARDLVRSYRDLGQIWYQIQTKFRNEARPKAGVMRSRQFIMMDSYSFDATLADLDLAYQKHYQAFSKIFARCGLKFFVVTASSGAMGGNQSQEFMIEASIGEDEVFLADQRGWVPTRIITATLLEVPGAQESDSQTQQSVAKSNAQLKETQNSADETKNSLVLPQISPEIPKNMLASAKTGHDSTREGLDSTQDRLASTENRVDDTNNSLETTQNSLDATNNKLDSTLNKAFLAGQTADEAASLLDASKNSLDLTQNRVDESKNSASQALNRPQKADEQLDESNLLAANAAKKAAPTRNKVASTIDIVYQSMHRVNKGLNGLVDAINDIEDRKTKLVKGANKFHEGINGLYQAVNILCYINHKLLLVGQAGGQATSLLSNAKDSPDETKDSKNIACKSKSQALKSGTKSPAQLKETIDIPDENNISISKAINTASQAQESATKSGTPLEESQDLVEKAINRCIECLERGYDREKGFYEGVVGIFVGLNLLYTYIEEACKDIDRYEESRKLVNQGLKFILMGLSDVSHRVTNVKKGLINLNQGLNILLEGIKSIAESFCYAANAEIAVSYIEKTGRIADGRTPMSGQSVLLAGQIAGDAANLLDASGDNLNEAKESESQTQQSVAKSNAQLEEAKRKARKSVALLKESRRLAEESRNIYAVAEQREGLSIRHEDKSKATLAEISSLYAKSKRLADESKNLVGQSELLSKESDFLVGQSGEPPLATGQIAGDAANLLDASGNIVNENNLLAGQAGGQATSLLFNAQDSESPGGKSKNIALKSDSQALKSGTKSAAQPQEAYSIFKTPDLKSIDQIVAQFGVPMERCAKTLPYLLAGQAGGKATSLLSNAKNSESPDTSSGSLATEALQIATKSGDTEEEAVIILMRGNDQLNEAKLEAALGTKQFRPMSEEECYTYLGAGYGSLGPVNTKEKVRIISDLLLEDANGLVSGANIDGYHIKDLDLRKIKASIIYRDLRMVQEGEASVVIREGRAIAGPPLKKVKAVEIGHIFKLGTKYAEALGAEFTDAEGKLHPIIMGSYGIGVERIIACYIEQNSDEKGIIWNKSLAPYLVHLIGVNNHKSEAVAEACENLYSALRAKNIEVLYDNRAETAGIKFNDADLLGMPLQLIVGERNLQAENVEIKVRRTGERLVKSLAEAVDWIKNW